MKRERLLAFLPLPKHGNARFVYQRLEDHFTDSAPCQHCERHGNTLSIKGKAIAHIKTIAYEDIYDDLVDINSIILYLRKGLIRYLATKDGAIITFCEIEVKKGAIAS